MNRASTLLNAAYTAANATSTSGFSFVSVQTISYAIVVIFVCVVAVLLLRAVHALLKTIAEIVSSIVSAFRKTKTVPAAPVIAVYLPTGAGFVCAHCAKNMLTKAAPVLAPPPADPHAARKVSVKDMLLRRSPAARDAVVSAPSAPAVSDSD